MDVVSKTKELANSSPVIGVDEHFAGYFNELGLSIHLRENCSSQAFEELGASVLNYLNETLPKGNDEFDWILFFYKGKKQIGLFFPGDDLSENSGEGITG